MNITLQENEEMFDVKPVGIRYICENCHKGEMIASNDTPLIIEGGIPRMRSHKCNNCGTTMLLPKTYPYIEWIPKEDVNETN